MTQTIHEKCKKYFVTEYINCFVGCGAIISRGGVSIDDNIMYSIAKYKATCHYSLLK